MSANDYFQTYIDIISDAFRKVRKIGFKKFSLIKDLLDTVESFLFKEVYGRIEPANYLLAMIVILGSKTPKLYSPIIYAVQRLYSYNFITPNEEVAGSLRLLREDHRQFLILPFEDYAKKSFKQLYIETLVNIGEKEDGLNLSIAKSLSLIWRLDQNSIPLSLVPKIFDFLLESMAACKIEDEEKMLKSSILQMFRHSLQSYRETQDKKLLNDENIVSVKTVCQKYGLFLADSVAIKLDVEEKYDQKAYSIIPEAGFQKGFKLFLSSQVNQKGLVAGKFGWCAYCRNSSNYYCLSSRLPVCTFECKQALQNQFLSLQKFLSEEQRTAQVLESHISGLFNIFRGYLSHPEIRKKLSFSQIFVLMTSQIKKISDKLSPNAYKELKGIVRQVFVNFYSQSQAYMSSMATLKKLFQLRIFLDQFETILRLLAKKLIFFLTAHNIRDEILKMIRQLINNRLLFDCAVALDCSPDHYDCVREVIDAVRQVYIGVVIPETISIPPPQDINGRRLAFQIAITMLKALQDNDRRMNAADTQPLVIAKSKLNKIRSNIQKFNKSEKPLKVIKKFIEEGFIPPQPEKVALFLHQNLRRLNPSNVGGLIGDIDQFAGQVRKHFIGMIRFSRLSIDDGMRSLLKHFTLPGQSQVVERIVQTFGITYFDQNKDGGVLVNSDAVYSLSYLIMMLQSNLHNPQVIDKMTLPQFSKLSKGMNGSPDAEFPNDFLEAIYISVQKTPLGVHEKLKQIQIIIAYNTAPKKAQEIYLKDLQKEVNGAFEAIQGGKIQYLSQNSVYPFPIFIEQFVGQIIDMIAWKIKDVEERQKQQLIKCIDLIEVCLKISHEGRVSHLVQRVIQRLWEEIQRSSVIKKYELMENMLQWSKKYGEHLNQQWKVIVFLISKFVRTKAIKKDANPNKNNKPIILIQNRCYLYDSFIEQLITKTPKYSMNNLIGLLKSFLSVSKDEINEGGFHFCLEKINQIIQLNATRSAQILNYFWPELKEYYSQLGKNKSEKIALFTSDFLKQLITKFLKRKDLLVYQRQYMKPLQDIFCNTKIFAVKQLNIGSLSYFVLNHHSNLKVGWKLILSIISSCFQEEEHQIIKEKAYGLLKKISQSNFAIFNLEENHNDFVQILNKLARQKEEIYPLGCLQIIQQIIQHYHLLLGINLDHGPQAIQHEKLDINFWQTIFLPLLSIIFPMCGDSRTSVQQPAIQCLFTILFKYGKLFKYQFWKMVLQGVLRPAFQEITYTSQSKPLKKSQLQTWLKNSFTQLFKSINDLIVLYYDDFRLFLEDVFKIYENCILNHSLKLLIVLSLDAMNDLLQKIAPNFQEHDWQVYLLFAQSLLKKTLPSQITSIELWNQSKDLLQNNYQAKCFALYIFMSKCQQIFDKFPESITQKIYLDMLKELENIFSFVVKFNQNIELRDSLWKNGFYQDIKILPGLIKHHYEIIKFKCKIHYKLINFSPNYLHDYFLLVIQIFETARKMRMIDMPPSITISIAQQERIYNNYRLLIADTLSQQIRTLGAENVKKAGVSEQLLEEALGLVGARTYCSRCQSCESCENAAESNRNLIQQMRKIIMMLFKGC